MPAYGEARIATAYPFIERVDHSWSEDLHDDRAAAKALADLIEPQVNAMNMCQYTRAQPVIPRTMTEAVWYEHHLLIDPSIVCCPEADAGMVIDPARARDPLVVEFQAQIKRRCILNRELDGLQLDDPKLQISSFFTEMRNRSYTVWPVRCARNHWVVILMRIDARPEGNRVIKDEDGNFENYFDRHVRTISVIDPMGRIEPSSIVEFLWNQVAPVLAKAGILVDSKTTYAVVQTPTVADVWETGFVCYAVVRELMRRFRRLLYHKGCSNDHFLWDDLQEDLNVDGWREAMGLACAMRGIQAGGYEPRLALELPGALGSQDPTLDVTNLWPGHEIEDETRESWWGNVTVEDMIGAAPYCHDRQFEYITDDGDDEDYVDDEEKNEEMEE